MCMLARLTNMNKYDRRHLHAASLRYCSTVQTAMNEYEAVIKLLLSREREKRDKIPNNLQRSRQACNIEESISTLKKIMEKLETMKNLCEDLAKSTNVCIPAELITKMKPSISDEPRPNRFQILLSDTLLIILKLRSLESGLSCNEIITQALQNELLKDPE